MAIGAVVISPLADRIGRRAHILLCLLLISGGMLLSASAQRLDELIMCRAFAGLFIGGVIASINVLVSEYSSEKRRGVVMGLYGIGLPLGSALAGSAIAPLVAHFGWRGPLACGGLLTLAMAAIVFPLLPESVEYLIERRPRRALENTTGSPPARLCAGARTARAGTQGTARPLPRPCAPSSAAMLRRTACLWLGYAGLIAAFYFANTDRQADRRRQRRCRAGRARRHADHDRRRGGCAGVRRAVASLAPCWSRP